LEADNHQHLASKGPLPLSERCCPGHTLTGYGISNLDQGHSR
jgi:hypothetical protein